jgi:DNA mismatch repair protein MutS
VHLDATEHGDGIVFLHAVKEGPANRSYGLQVAQLAGVPREVIAEARRYLEQLESERERHRATAAGHSPCGAQTELSLFQAMPDELRTALLQVDPDQLSPKAALEVLYRLKTLIR